MTYGLADVVQLRRRIEESPAQDAHRRILRQRLDAMLGYCETARCRREVLLAYFGQERPGPCGACDTCLSPPETWDATIATQKALSACLRTGQRFGAGYLVDVLLGTATERILANGHDRVKTFGAGAELSDREWRTVVRQLVAVDLLRVDPRRGGAIEVTPQGAEALADGRTIELRRVRESAAPRRRRAPSPALVGDADPDLYAALRATRKQLADDQGVPAYVVFPDSTLHEMAVRRPRSLEELRSVGGVGEVKLERYGEAFLEVLARGA